MTGDKYGMLWHLYETSGRFFKGSDLMNKSSNQLTNDTVPIPIPNININQ